MSKSFVWVALAMWSVAACIVQQPAPTAQPGAAPAAQPGAGAAYGAGGGGATCDAACQHYLGCKGVADPATYQGCVAECAELAPAQDQLDAFVQLDCATAIATIEGGQGGQGGGASGGGGGTDCNGCAWDGSQCVWLSQSNWGAGPYSGAASSCDPSCCGR